MKFVSRRIGDKKYGVYDTDSGEEIFLPISELVKLCCDGGVDIKGVSIAEYSTNGVAQRLLEKVDVYQPVNTCSLLQLKTSLLLQTDITLFGDVITGIQWRSEEMTGPVSIRLSDYGRFCADRIFACCRLADSKKITFILDDKVVFGEWAFISSLYLGIGGCGAVFDLRELSDEKRAMMVYDTLVTSASSGVVAFQSVIDSPTRIKLMQDLLADRG